MSSEVRSGGAIALLTSGIASAFSLAACCALLILLAGLGLSADRLAPVAGFGLQFRTPLTVLAVVCLAGSVFIVKGSAGTCMTGDLCARRWFRAGIAAAAVLGTALLAASKFYA